MTEMTYRSGVYLRTSLLACAVAGKQCILRNKVQFQNEVQPFAKNEMKRLEGIIPLNSFKK